MAQLSSFITGGAVTPNLATTHKQQHIVMRHTSSQSVLSGGSKIICENFAQMQKLKAEVGSLVLVSSGKNSTITLQHIVIQLSWENTRLLHLSLALYSDHDEGFLANHRSFQRACVPVCCSKLRFSTSWLAVETGYVPFVLNLASGGLTSWVAGWAETDQLTLLQLSLQLFHLVVNFWCKLALKERLTTNKLNCELEQKQGGKAAVKLLSDESHGNVSLLAY